MHPTLAGLYPFLLGSPGALSCHILCLYICLGSPARSRLSRSAVALTGAQIINMLQPPETLFRWTLMLVGRRSHFRSLATDAEKQHTKLPIRHPRVEYRRPPNCYDFISTHTIYLFTFTLRTTCYKCMFFLFLPFLMHNVHITC